MIVTAQVSPIADVRGRPLWILALGLALGGCFDSPPTVEIGSGSSGTTDASTSAGSTAVATDVDPTESTATLGTTGTSAGTSSTDASTSAESGETGDPADFFDDFERADAADLGNGWQEKQPTAFHVALGEVVGEDPVGLLFSDTMVYRDPLVRDVELSMVFRITTENMNNEPYLVARMQESSLELGAPYHGYTLVPQINPELRRLCIKRFHGAAGGNGMMCEPWEPAVLELGVRHRLVLRVTGDGPVQLDGRLEREQDRQWEEVLSVSWEDSNAQQIIAPGRFGFGGGTGGAQLNNFRIDDYGATFLD